MLLTLYSQVFILLRQIQIALTCNAKLHVIIQFLLLIIYNALLIQGEHISVRPNWKPPVKTPKCLFSFLFVFIWNQHFMINILYNVFRFVPRITRSVPDADQISKSTLQVATGHHDLPSSKENSSFARFLAFCNAKFWAIWCILWLKWRSSTFNNVFLGSRS